MPEQGPKSFGDGELAEVAEFAGIEEAAVALSAELESDVFLGAVGDVEHGDAASGAVDLSGVIVLLAEFVFADVDLFDEGFVLEEFEAFALIEPEAEAGLASVDGEVTGVDGRHGAAALGAVEDRFIGFAAHGVTLCLRW